jgi:YVTN family beta-propeller protein
MPPPSSAPSANPAASSVFPEYPYNILASLIRHQGDMPMTLTILIRRAIPVFLALAFLFLATYAPAQSQTPSPALLVLNKADATLSIIDPTTLKTLAQIPTGEGPHELAVSDDGKFAFVANYGARTPGSTISVMDLLAQKELRRVDLGALRRPHGITFADGKVWFTAEQNKLIARYDPAANQMDWSLEIGQDGTHMLVFSKDRSLGFTSNIGSDSITLLQRASNPSGWTLTNIPVGKGPEGADVSPDAREFWAANSGDGTVSIIDVAAKKVAQTLDLRTNRANRLKFTPDGKLVLISDIGGNGLVIVDAATRKEIKRLNLGRQPEGILIVPDGSRAYVALAGEKSVSVLDLKSIEVIAHIPTGNDPDGLAWAARH